VRELISVKVSQTPAEGGHPKRDTSRLNETLLAKFTTSPQPRTRKGVGGARVVFVVPVLQTGVDACAVFP